MKQIIFYTLALITLFAASTGIAGSNITQEIEIILDASGSMKAKLKGRTKMAIAKQALLELVEKLSKQNNLALGLRIYGHQSHKSKKDCKDSKLEIGFAKPDPKKVKALLSGVIPQGYTPISYSLLQAQKDFSTSKTLKKTIILITDGLETCPGDPCQVAEAMAQKGLNVTLHVVGFDLNKKQMQKLTCLTKPSNGLLLEAKDANQLAKSLDKAIAKTLAFNLKVLVKDAKDKPCPAHVEVFKANTKKRITIHQGAETRFSLAHGHYDLIVRDFKSKQMAMVKNLEVFPDKVIEKTVILASANLQVVLKNTKGEPIKGYVETALLNQGRKTQIQGTYLSQKPHTFKVSPGKHTISAQVDKMGYKKIVNNLLLKAGEQASQEFIFGQSQLDVSAQDNKGQKLDCYVEVWRLEKGSKTGYKSQQGSERPLLFKLVPGEYQIKIRRLDTKAKIQTNPFIIKDGQKISRVIKFD